MKTLLVYLSLKFWYDLKIWNVWSIYNVNISVLTMRRTYIFYYFLHCLSNVHYGMINFQRFSFFILKNNFHPKISPFCIWENLLLLVLVAKFSYYYIWNRVKLHTRLTKIHLWWDSWTKLHLWHTKWTCFRLLSHGVL